MSNHKLVDRLLNRNEYEEALTNCKDLSFLSAYDITRLMWKKHIRNDIERLFSLGLKKECNLSSKIPFEFYSTFDMDAIDLMKKFTHADTQFAPIMNELVRTCENIDTKDLIEFFSKGLRDDSFDKFVQLDEKCDWYGTILWNKEEHKIIDVLLIINMYNKRIFRYLVDKYQYEVTRSLILSFAVCGLYPEEVEYLLDLNFTLDDPDYKFVPNDETLFVDTHQFTILIEIIERVFEKIETGNLVNYFRDFLVSEGVYPNKITTTIINNFYKRGWCDSLEL